jgi:aminoglycoside phosphotransferase (APT) family kinase protein
VHPDRPCRSLLSVGAPDRRPAAIAELATDLAVDHTRVAELVAALDGCPLPATLVHEEIHDGNVVVRDGSAVIIDWADSCIGHPFFGVVVGLRSLSDRLDLAPAPSLSNGC